MGLGEGWAKLYSRISYLEGCWWEWGEEARSMWGGGWGDKIFLKL